MGEDLKRWEEIVKDLRIDAENARKSANAMEVDSGRDKSYGIKVGEAYAFGIAADRIAGGIEELLYA